MTSELHKVYPTLAESEEQMLDDLASFLDQLDLDSPTRHHLTLCLSEAFTNALKHGNRWDRSKDVALNITVNDEAIIADITDQGKDGLEAIRKRRSPEILAESGRGVDFMYRYCPDTQFREVEGGGLQVTLKMRRSTMKQSNTTSIMRR